MFKRFYLLVIFASSLGSTGLMAGEKVGLPDDLIRPPTLSALGAFLRTVEHPVATPVPVEETVGATDPYDSFDESPPITPDEQVAIFFDAARSADYRTIRLLLSVPSQTELIAAIYRFDRECRLRTARAPMSARAMLRARYECFVLDVLPDSFTWQRDRFGRTPLHYVTDVDMAKLLLSEGLANIDAVDFDGRTALHLAVLLKRWRVVKWLLQLGADVRIEDCSGLIAADYVFVDIEGQPVAMTHTLENFHSALTPIPPPRDRRATATPNVSPGGRRGHRRTWSTDTMPGSRGGRRSSF